MNKKKCPFKKHISYIGYHDGRHNALLKQSEATHAVEDFEDCIKSDCMAWDEQDNICSMFSSKRVFNVEEE